MTMNNDSTMNKTILKENLVYVNRTSLKGTVSLGSYQSKSKR